MHSCSLARRQMRDSSDHTSHPFIDAAEHERLSVVALLHTDVQIGVLVAGKEEVTDQLIRIVFGQNTRIDVMAVIRVKVLVKAARHALDGDSPACVKSSAIAGTSD